MAWLDTSLIKTGWACKCPKCKQGDLYASKFTMNLRNACPHCGLDYTKSDLADGPAVFLIFILGFVLVPIALILDALYTIPLWGHGILWTSVTLILTLGTLRPLKAYVLALQYKHLPWDQEETQSNNSAGSDKTDSPKSKSQDI